MFGVLTPARRRGVEILDDGDTPPDVRVQSMRDVERSNRFFGGARAVQRAFDEIVLALPRDAVLLDVGAGMGDIDAAVTARARHAGVSLACVGVDMSHTLLRASNGRLQDCVVADAAALPFRDGSVDVALCSQLLHHFDTTAAGRVVAELDRVARQAVVIADIRRSWFAAIGFWISAF